MHKINVAHRWMGLVAGAALVLALALWWPGQVRADSEPGKPTELSGAVVSEGIELVWVAPAEEVTGYQILRRRPEEGEKKLHVYVLDTGTTDTIYTDTVVEHKVRYVYRVVSLNKDLKSGKSNFVNIRWNDPLPGPPTELLARSHNDGIRLGWTAPGGEVTGYQILRRKPKECESDFVVLVEDTGDDTAAYTDTDAIVNVKYIYRVKAIRDDEMGPPSNFTVLVYRPLSSLTMSGSPQAPHSLDSVGTTEGILLTWKAPSQDSGITGYQILRRSPDACEKTLRVHQADTGNTNVRWIDRDVEVGTRYVYRVKAINDHGPGQQSNASNTTMGIARIIVMMGRDKGGRITPGYYSHIEVSFSQLEWDDDPDTVDYSFIGLITRRDDGSRGYGCEDEGLGETVNITVIDDISVQFSAEFGGSNCEIGDYHLVFELYDRNGDYILTAGPWEFSMEVNQPVDTD